MRYVRFIEDDNGDLLDIEIYCSAFCWHDAGLGDSSGHGWPVPEQTDYDQHCPSCGEVVVAAIGTPAFDGWPVKRAA